MHRFFCSSCASHRDEGRVTDTTYLHRRHRKEREESSLSPNNSIHRPTSATATGRKVKTLSTVRLGSSARRARVSRRWERVAEVAEAGEMAKGRLGGSWEEGITARRRERSERDEGDPLIRREVLRSDSRGTGSVAGGAREDCESLQESGGASCEVETRGRWESGRRKRDGSSPLLTTV
jgi:hypothetical protein